MPDINWKEAWESALKNNNLFPAKSVKNKTVSISCPTRFSNTGEFAIDITPSFNDSSIDFEILLFNDNVSIDDLELTNEESSKKEAFNKLSKSLVDYELSNRILDRFTIKSDGFDTQEEAVNALIDYINNKATESGRMFDDKLDELNDIIDNNKSEGYDHIVESIKTNRKYIFSKVENILKNNYGWKPSKNEDFSDSTTTFYDNSNNLAAVVSLVDGNLIIDLSKNITAKISIMKSDEEIENEIVSDIDNAEELLADKEIEQLKDIVSDNQVEIPFVRESYYDKLERRIAKLESTYIRKMINKI